LIIELFNYFGTKNVKDVFDDRITDRMGSFYSRDGIWNTNEYLFRFSEKVLVHNQ